MSTREQPDAQRQDVQLTGHALEAMMIESYPRRHGSKPLIFALSPYTTVELVIVNHLQVPMFEDRNNTWHTPTTELQY